MSLTTKYLLQARRWLRPFQFRLHYSSDLRSSNRHQLRPQPFAASADGGSFDLTLDTQVTTTDYWPVIPLLLMMLFVHWLYRIYTSFSSICIGLICWAYHTRSLSSGENIDLYIFSAVLYIQFHIIILSILTCHDHHKYICFPMNSIVIQIVFNITRCNFMLSI